MVDQQCSVHEFVLKAINDFRNEFKEYQTITDKRFRDNEAKQNTTSENVIEIKTTINYLARDFKDVSDKMTKNSENIATKFEQMADHIQKIIDEPRKKQFEVWKIFLAAGLGLMSTVLITLFTVHFMN